MKRGVDGETKQSTNELLHLLQRVNQGDYSGLRQYLQQHRTTYLQLNTAESKQLNFQHLGKALTGTPVRTLELSRTRLTSQQARSLSCSLTQVTTLGLARNALGDQGLTDVLQVNDSITFLNLESNHITAKGASIIAKNLPKMHALTTLWMPNNPLGAIGVACLARALNQNTPFTCLGLSNTEMGDEGATSLAAALKICRTTKKLALSSNKIGPQGAKALFSALIDSDVEELALGDNPIGDEGIAELAKVISRTKLKRVYLSATGMTDHGAALLFEALPGSSVEILHLQNNKITDESLFYLSCMLKPSKQLREVNLEGNYIRDLSHLANGLKGSHLLVLGLGGNPIRDLQPLIDAVPHTHLLEVRGVNNRELYQSLRENRNKFNREWHQGLLSDRLVDIEAEMADHSKRLKA